MESRLRENPKRIFECFCEVVIPSSSDESCWILQKFPDTYNDEEMLKNIIEFSYPCEFTNISIQHFSFVLTSIDSKWTYGYCRHTPKAPNFFVLISCFPWHETVCRILNHIAELTDHREPGDLSKFLHALYDTEVPEPGMNLHVAYNQGKNNFVASTIDYHKLPSIPEDRNLTEYFSAVSVNNMMTVFASMLHERRILITSKKLSQLSACVQAVNLLIYPMCWQHIFIPILPKHLLDYVSAPMPFLIGVPSTTIANVNTSELGEVVILHVDINKVETSFNDLESLPSDVMQTLKKNLKQENILLGDGLSRAFLRALIQLIGGYREALRLQLGEKISFDSDAFIQTRPVSMQPFLQKMLHLQIFQQFIEGRLEMLNTGQGFGDEFELELNMYEEKSGSRLKTQYKEWLQTMKKEGGAFFKNVKYKVKDRSKRAYKDLRSRLYDMQIQKLRNVKEETMKTAIEELKTSKTFRHTKVQHYNLLHPDEGLRDSEDSVSDTESGAGFQLQKLDMDLMGDLQDLIFRRCSISLSEETDIVNSDSIKHNKIHNGPVNTVALLPPIPPPRTKRNVSSIKTSQEKTIQNNTTIDTPLIKLDQTEDIFDPLQEGYQLSSVDNKPLTNILSSIPVSSTSPPNFHQSTDTFLNNISTRSTIMPPQCKNYTADDFHLHQAHSSNQLYDDKNISATPDNPFTVHCLSGEGNNITQIPENLLTDGTPSQIRDQKLPLVVESKVPCIEDPFADLVNWQVSNLSKTSEKKTNIPATWEQFQ